MSGDSPAGEPIVWREPVLPEWIDYNGHLSEPYYVLVFGHSTDAVMDAVGIGPAYREAEQVSLFTVEAHIRYLDQVSLGADLETRSWVIGRTHKLLWMWHELWVDDRLRATEEILGVYVDTATGRSAPFADRVSDLIDQHLTAPPASASRRISI